VTIARRGETFDEAVPSTHGIQVSSLPLTTHVLDAPVTLKIWDFGGQDIYHGTHALFLKPRAVFSVVWTPGVFHAEPVVLGPSEAARRWRRKTGL
jgi:hypothetical protein